MDVLAWMTHTSFAGGDQEEKCAQQAVLLVADAITSMHRLPRTSNEDDIIDESPGDAPEDSSAQQSREAAAAKWQEALHAVHSKVRSSCKVGECDAKLPADIHQRVPVRSNTKRLCHSSLPLSAALHHLPASLFV